MKKNKTPKQLAEEEANELWRRAVWEKSDGFCFVCGGKGSDPHHFIFKSRSLALKYDVRNGILLCKKCHSLIHKRQDSVIQGIIAIKKGKDWIEYLRERKKETTIKTKRWLEEQIKNLRRELKI